MSSLMDQLISQLVFESEIVPATDVAFEKKQQENQKSNLLAKAESSNLQQSYLHYYDAILRSIELILISYGYRLGIHPHLVTKKLFNEIDSKVNINYLVNARHSIKKQNTFPTLRDIEMIIEAHQSATAYVLRECI